MVSVLYFEERAPLSLLMNLDGECPKATVPAILGCKLAGGCASPIDYDVPHARVPEVLRHTDRKDDSELQQSVEHQESLTPSSPVN